ncbi:hypothetical protein DL96DRAFT_1602465 [Flagelloscypha sp. PMI_526]|nr:hypothetical protein DL96DRAFT_1602465 [Flagelloscypha sp. PMI_526]
MYPYPVQSNNFDFVSTSPTARSHHPEQRRQPPSLDMDFVRSSQPSVRSPTASYPLNYNVEPTPNHYYSTQESGIDMSSRSYRTGVSRSYSPPPISPSSTEETPIVKKKRRRADANQLRVLNATYERTAFPTTEERLALAHQLEMSARSVQIWFQNKRQAMKQTNRHSATVGSGGDVHPYGSAPPSYGGSQRPSHSPSSTHRRSRTQEDLPSGRRGSSQRP